MLLHVGGASTAGVIVGVVVIFFLMFAMSFAFGRLPEGKRRFSGDWMSAWFRVSWPRILVAGVFSGLLLVGGLNTNNGSSSSAPTNCEQPLPPLSGGAVTDARLVLAIDGIQRLAEAARDGDTNEVRTIFYNEDAHNLTHDIDLPLRQQDPATGVELCEQVLSLESQMAGEFDTTRIAIHSDAIASILGTARAVLSGVTATPEATSSACQSTVAPLSTDPLTQARIETAAAEMRQVAQLADQGDAAAARDLFFQEPHNITHDLDGPLRVADSDVAVNLCLSILAIERNFAGQFDGSLVASEAETSAALIEDAGRTLGIIP